MLDLVAATGLLVLLVTMHVSYPQGDGLCVHHPGWVGYA
jgi:hypothetical protein